VDVNCAAIPETLLVTELFGFERGAFTDAHRSKAGLFQTANRGTIFLDEIGLLPEALQAKLLILAERFLAHVCGPDRVVATAREPPDPRPFRARCYTAAACPASSLTDFPFRHRLRPPRPVRSFVHG
jgi:hypothetical protein